MNRLKNNISNGDSRFERKIWMKISILEKTRKGHVCPKAVYA